MPTLHEFLRAEQQENKDWRFHIPTELHGAFGGAFGGVVCACTLVAARSTAPGRTPNALDIRFVRGLRAGSAFARTTVLHAGRSLTNVSVDLTGEDGKLCARGTISLVDPTVLDPFERSTATAGKWSSYDDASSLPAIAPIVSVIEPRLVGHRDGSFALAVRVPWSDSGHSAEAACMAGDMAVGPPLGSGAPSGVGTPNPDLSLRFCGEVEAPVIVGVGRWHRSSGGVAAVGVEVWSGDALVAIGISTALLLPARP